MWETWVQSLGQEDSLEKGMATRFSILAWEIPWMEEPGGATIHGVAKSQTWLSDSMKTTLWSKALLPPWVRSAHSAPCAGTLDLGLASTGFPSSSSFSWTHGQALCSSASALERCITHLPALGSLFPDLSSLTGVWSWRQGFLSPLRLKPSHSQLDQLLRPTARGPRTAEAGMATAPCPQRRADKNITSRVICHWPAYLSINIMIKTVYTFALVICRSHLHDRSRAHTSFFCLFYSEGTGSPRGQIIYIYIYIYTHPATSGEAQLRVPWWRKMTETERLRVGCEWNLQMYKPQRE